MSLRGHRHMEAHRSGRAAWLRAAVLGADDAIVSTASLMIGVAASSAPKSGVLIAGVAGLVGGAMSMAVGEYVSVSSQRDAERAVQLVQADFTRPACDAFKSQGSGGWSESRPWAAGQLAGRGSSGRSTRGPA